MFVCVCVLTEMYSLTVLEARSSKLRCWQDCAVSAGSKGQSVPYLSFSFSRFQQHFVFPLVTIHFIWLHIPWYWVQVLSCAVVWMSPAAAAAAKSLQSCPTLCDPMTAAHQALLSLGFSRQEHWSGLPFPSPMRESEVSQSCPILSDPMDGSLPGSSIHGIFQARVLEWVATAFSRSIY